MIDGSIFDDNGYLKEEYINPNYSGVVGFPIDQETLYGSGRGLKYRGTLKATFFMEGHRQIAFLYKDCSATVDPLKNRYHHYKIPKFTLSDIKMDELVWVKSDFFNCEEWGLYQMSNKYLNGIYQVVPYLIAENAGLAEELKEWSNE